MKTKKIIAIIIIVILVIVALICASIVYFKIDISKYIPIKKASVIYTKEQCRESAKKWIEKLGKTAFTDDVEETEKDGIYTYKTKEYEISIDSRTNNISSYKAEKEKYQNQIIELKELLEISKEVTSILELKDYKVTGLGKNKDYTAKLDLTKEENNMLNIGQKVKVVFEIPTKEIILIEVLNAEYANNPVRVTNLRAKEIAEEYKTKYNADSYEVAKKIVMPEEGSKVNENKTRLAYECKFNTKQVIYIDCTNGEIILTIDNSKVEEVNTENVDEQEKN